MAAARLTPNQKDTLLRLCRLSAMLEIPRPGRWIYDKDCGGPAALEHLCAKGYVERELRVGPRGGEHGYYRPSPDGWAVRDKQAVKDAEERAEATREMPLHEIDTRLIEARKNGEVVRVFVGPSGEFRGVPGEVERDGVTGRAMLTIGQRRVPLKTIRKVTA